MRLTLPLDVDVCVVGAGLAGLTAALEAARLGASVVVLEARHVGSGASGNPMGSVIPGFALPLTDLIARVGLEDARELWALSQQGADYVRTLAAEDAISAPGGGDGALEVSNVDVGEKLIARLQMLSEDFDTDVEGWQVERVRDTLKTRRYFHAVHYPQAFQIDGRKYLRGLATRAVQAGVRLFEDTPVLSIDAEGIRKRIVTPSARLRASHVVLAGNIHLGAPAQRLSDTLLPVWRYAGITEPLGERLADAVTFRGAVTDTDGVDHFRIVEGDRLMWSSPETTWAMKPERFARIIAGRIRTVFPQLGKVAVTETFGGATGRTVHGMPQIGQMRPGLWVASGFGYQGLNTSAMAGQLIARGMYAHDDRHKLFAPFELVWAGGKIGRAVGHAVGIWQRQASALDGTLARYRERAGLREQAREARLAAANARAGARLPPTGTGRHNGNV